MADVKDFTDENGEVDYQALEDAVYRECDEYLELFETYLKEEMGLADSTISGHVSKLNELFWVMVREECYDVHDAWTELGMLIPYYQIHKYGVHDKRILNSYIVSTRKFYKFMAEKGYISKSKFKEIDEYIRFYKDDWLEEAW